MPPVRDWIDPQGVPVRIYAARWKGAARDWVFALRVVGMLISERRNYQLVYFLMQGLHLAAGLPVARFLRKSILMKVGGSGVIPLMTRSPTGRAELRWLRRWADRLMILNQGMREEALREGFPAEQILWMPNPVDTDEFAPANTRERNELRARFRIPLAAPVVLYSGRLAPEKSLPSLVEAFALVIRKMPKAVLVLVGDGPVRATLVEQSEKLRLPAGSVRIVGSVKPEEVSSWLKIADTFALVSPSEGFSCALTEAMSAALPSVVSDIPANRQLIDDGKHGLLIPFGDVDAIADAILRLFADDALRRRMGESARRRVRENYSTAKVTDRYEILFRSCARFVAPINRHPAH